MKLEDMEINNIRIYDAIDFLRDLVDPVDTKKYRVALVLVKEPLDPRTRQIVIWNFNI